MKNKFIVGFITCLTVLSILGCGGLLSKNSGKPGKAAKIEASSAAPIDNTQKQLNDTKDQRLTSIGSWSKGVEYSINKITNDEPAKEISLQINDRVEALANKPDLKEQEEIYKIIDSFLTNAVMGQKMLAEKDKQIIKLQTHISDLNNKHETAVSDYRNNMESVARQSDAYKATIQEIDSGWGLAAIWYGIKKLISRIALTLGILAVIFFLLRILSTTSPIAASIFAVFERMGSWAINILAKIVPRATSLANFTPSSDYKGYKDTLRKIVDAIETVKSKEDVLKKVDPAAIVSIDDLSTEISKAFSSEDAERVSAAKKDLLWKL